VIHEYALILKSLIDQKKIPLGEDAVFKAVAWNAEWPPGEDGHGSMMRMRDYCPAFSKAGIRPRADHDYIGGYLQAHASSLSFPGETCGSLLSMFLKVLRLEGVVNPGKGSAFTSSTLRRYLRENHPEFCEALLLRMYRWTLASAERHLTGVEDEVRATIKEMLVLFGRSICHSRGFVDNKESHGQRDAQMPPANACTFDGITIQLSTVHGVKGETHTATLYLESFYHQDGRGPNAKSYESQRLASQFLGSTLTGAEGIRVKQSAKMAYVGFSRPMHLLCFAVHRDRFDQYLTQVDRSAWEVVVLPGSRT
jgi:hypothetical protein